jgi:hypothetical protein
VRRRIAIAAAWLGLAAAGCGHYAAPVRPPAIIPDAGPVYDAGQPPDTAEEQREQRRR